MRDEGMGEVSRDHSSSPQVAGEGANRRKTTAPGILDARRHRILLRLILEDWHITDT